MHSDKSYFSQIFLPIAVVVMEKTCILDSQRPVVSSIPPIQEIEMSVRCRLCSSSDLRLSRFRFKDLPHLLILSYPVRCRVCRDRDYLFILRIFKIGQDAKTPNGSARGLEKAQTE